MKINLMDFLAMIDRGETTEEYRKRIRKLKKYVNEKYDLEDAIDVLSNDPIKSEKLNTKKKRLAKVEKIIRQLDIENNFLDNFYYYRR